MNDAQLTRDKIKQKRLRWIQISEQPNLSEDFIRQHADEVNWHYICWKQNLSLKFMEEFKDRLDWDWVFNAQKITENFAIKYMDRIAPHFSRRELLGACQRQKLNFNKLLPHFQKAKKRLSTS